MTEEKNPTYFDYAYVKQVLFFVFVEKGKINICFFYPIAFR